MTQQEALDRLAQLVADIEAEIRARYAGVVEPRLFRQPHPGADRHQPPARSGTLPR